MTKKIGLLLLSLFVIFGFGVSFANPIAIDLKDFPKVCYKLKNVEIDNYKVIIEHGDRENSNADPNDLLRAIGRENNREREIYEPKAKECTKCLGRRPSKVYLLDKNISVKDITQENIDDMTIFVGEIYNSDCSSNYDKIESYKITKNGKNYEIVLSKTVSIKDIGEFPRFWFLAVIIETLVLFFISKLFRKEGIINKKLLLFGIVPTTITLPLLRFLLPLVLGDGIRYTIFGEILVTIIEAIIIKYGLKISRGKAVIASFVCNLFSFVIGSGSALIKDYYDSHEIIFSIPILIRIFRPLVYIFIEFMILCVAGRIWGNSDEIPNKRLFLTGILAPIVSILTLMMLVLAMIEVEDGLESRLENRLENLGIFVAFVISLFLKMLYIKYSLKISWKKTIVISILCELLTIVIISLC